MSSYSPTRAKNVLHKIISDINSSSNSRITDTRISNAINITRTRFTQIKEGSTKIPSFNIIQSLIDFFYDEGYLIEFEMFSESSNQEIDLSKIRIIHYEAPYNISELHPKGTIFSIIKKYDHNFPVNCLCEYQGKIIVGTVTHDKKNKFLTNLINREIIENEFNVIGRIVDVKFHC